jgi:hypothetical protein
MSKKNPPLHEVFGIPKYPVDDRKDESAPETIEHLKEQVRTVNECLAVVRHNHKRVLKRLKRARKVIKRLIHVAVDG